MPKITTFVEVKFIIMIATVRNQNCQVAFVSGYELVNSITVLMKFPFFTVTSNQANPMFRQFFRINCRVVSNNTVIEMIGDFQFLAKFDNPFNVTNDEFRKGEFRTYTDYAIDTMLSRLIDYACLESDPMGVTPSFVQSALNPLVSEAKNRIMFGIWMEGN